MTEAGRPCSTRLSRSYSHSRLRVRDIVRGGRGVGCSSLPWTGRVLFVGEHPPAQVDVGLAKYDANNSTG